MNTQDLIARRPYRIVGYLWGRQNQDVSLEDIQKFLNAPPEGALGSDPVNKDSIVTAIKTARFHVCPAGYELHVSKEKDYARLDQTDITSIDERMHQHPEIKAGLGFIFWKWSLCIDFEENFEEEATHQDSVRAKVAALRARTSLAVLVDAGSTTHAVIRALLDVKSIPIRPKSVDTVSAPKASKGAAHGCIPELQGRFINPSIMTNSLSIARMVSASRHAGRIPLSIIGGKFHTRLSSICGSMTDHCLQSWNGHRTDMSIIGTTGSWRYPDGIRGFACDDLDEAHLKAKLLDVGFFRVIVMTSDKAASSQAGHLFAPLSSSVIDLIVIDDGTETGAKQYVDELRREADRAGVTVLTLQMKARKTNRK